MVIVHHLPGGEVIRAIGRRQSGLFVRIPGGLGRHAYGDGGAQQNSGADKTENGKSPPRTDLGDQIRPPIGESGKENTGSARHRTNSESPPIREPGQEAWSGGGIDQTVARPEQQAKAEDRGKRNACGRQAEEQNTQPAPEPTPVGDGWMNIPDGIDEELPFN